MPGPDSRLVRFGDSRQADASFMTGLTLTIAQHGWRKPTIA
jgi:hypothetical protein